MTTGQIYLGDGVYFQCDGWQIKLICDCMSEPNAIYLDPFMIKQLNNFCVEMVKQKMAENTRDAHEQAD